MSTVLRKDFDAQSTLNRGVLKDIPINQITPDAAGLRKSVNKKHEGWPGFVASIRRDGIQLPITVRENPDPKAPHKFIVVDGLHRYTAAMEILEQANNDAEFGGGDGIDPNTYMLPCNVIKVNEAMDVYRLQLVSNLQNVETRPIQVLEHIMSMIATAKEQGQELTQAEIAAEIGKSQTFVSNILKLKNLDEKTADLVVKGKIKAANAYNLAKLPKEEQVHWVERAQTMDSEEFAQQSTTFLTEWKARERESRPDPNQFQANPKLVSKAEALGILDDWYKRNLKNIPQDMIAERGAELVAIQGRGEQLPTDFVLGAYYGMQRLLELDSASVERKKAEHAATVAERERKKAEADAQKAQKSADERGVSILAPKGAKKPIGFGSVEEEVEAEAAA